MIYIDVTAACLLPLQSGIPRAARGLYRNFKLRQPEETRPIFWQPFRGTYTDLSQRARGLLDDPFGADGKPKRTPRDSTLPLLTAGFIDLLSGWPASVPLSSCLRQRDILFLTALFPDNRLGYLEKALALPGLKVAVFHDVIPLHDANVRAWEKRRHVKTLQLLAKFDAVIAVSQAAADDLEAAWRQHRMAATASVFVLPWPVDFPGARPEFTPPPWEKKKILYVSRLKQVKNHATLFSACARLWNEGLDFEVELIGCEDEVAESRAIVEAIARLRQQGRPIRWLGQVSESDLHEAYRRATFTVFPSLVEGFGLPIIESLWHGRPVICSQRDPMGSLVRPGGGVAIDVTNSEEFAATMRGLLRDESKCLALAKEAHARPMRTWAEYWEELKPILENR